MVAMLNVYAYDQGDLVQSRDETAKSLARKLSGKRVEMLCKLGKELLDVVEGKLTVKGHGTTRICEARSERHEIGGGEGIARAVVPTWWVWVIIPRGSPQWLAKAQEPFSSSHQPENRGGGTKMSLMSGMLRRETGKSAHHWHATGDRGRRRVHGLCRA